MLTLSAVWALYSAFSGVYVVSDASGADIKAELETAIASYSEIVVDSGSYTLSGDVLVTHPISIKIMPGASLAFANNPTLDDGQDAQGSNNWRYGTGMFVLKGAAQGSHIQCYGSVDVNLDNIPDQGSQEQHVAFVFLQGASRTKITGSCAIRKTFNGITVVDSHDVYIQGVHLTDPPANENAAVDVEASDRIYVVDVTADSYEEVVDFNGLSYGGYVSVFGENIVENVLEINNSVGIRGEVFAENSPSILAVEDYPPASSAFTRWSLLGRDYITNSNNLVDVINLGAGADGPPGGPPPSGTLVSANNTVSDTNNIGDIGNYRSATEFQLSAGSAITGVGIRGSRGATGVSGTFNIEDLGRWKQSNRWDSSKKRDIQHKQSAALYEQSHYATVDVHNRYRTIGRRSLLHCAPRIDWWIERCRSLVYQYKQSIFRRNSVVWNVRLEQSADHRPQF